jgi:hypothetical protein
MALKGISRLAGHLRNVLSRQTNSSRFLPRITELGSIEILSSSAAARLAHHYGTELHWTPEAEEAPVQIPDRAHPAYRLCRLLANAFVAIVPKGYRVTVLESVLWFHAPMGASGVHVFDAYVDSAEPLAERVEKIAMLAATRLQQLIVGETGQPWPAGAVNATPGASYVDDELKVWFGDDGSRLLELPAVSLPVRPGIHHMPGL